MNRIIICISLLVANINGQCQYRQYENLSLRIFSVWSTWGCYHYNRPDLFKCSGPLEASSCEIIENKIKYYVPGLKNQNGCVPFNYSNEFVQNQVEKSFKFHTSFDKWLQCCKDAVECCQYSLSSLQNQCNNKCNVVWDGWTCFGTITAGETSKQICSRYAYARESPRCNHFSYKTCQNNSTWELQTDYSACSVTPMLIERTQWYLALMSISTIICLPGVFGLIFSKSLQSQRFQIIRNLMIAIILRNICAILIKSIVIMDELTSPDNTIMTQNFWPCKTLSFFEKFTLNLVFTCMLLEGIYLHQLLTNPFHTRQFGGPSMKYYNFFGFILAFVTALSWAIMMNLNYDENCWQITEGTEFSLILDIPRMLMLIINVILLIRIIYVVWEAFSRKSSITSSQTCPSLRTVKAALICLPAFGIPYILLIVHPETDNCSVEQIIYIAFYIIECLQGILIVSLHCYAENDVKKIYTNSYDIIRKKFTSASKSNATKSDDDTMESHF